ncbi:hypothetical protein B0T17DRAFT_513455, partial [Bombardia bombarda]
WLLGGTLLPFSAVGVWMRDKSILYSYRGGGVDARLPRGLTDGFWLAWERGVVRPQQTRLWLALALVAQRVHAQFNREMGDADQKRVAEMKMIR